MNAVHNLGNAAVKKLFLGLNRLKRVIADDVEGVVLRVIEINRIHPRAGFLVGLQLAKPHHQASGVAFGVIHQFSKVYVQRHLIEKLF